MARADKFTQNDLKNQVYSDFLTDMNRHPVSGDITRFVNEQAVIRSCKNLIMTNRGERPYQPRVGSNIHKALFEPMDDLTTHQISNFVKETLEQNEPRVKILQLNTLADYDNNQYIVSLTVMILNKQDPVSFSVNLQRVR